MIYRTRYLGVECLGTLAMSINPHPPHRRTFALPPTSTKAGLAMAGQKKWQCGWLLQFSPVSPDFTF